MDRVEYCQVCQLFNITGKQTVKFDGMLFYPKALELTYNKNGTPKYTAVLQSTTALRSIVKARVEKVEAI